MKAASVVCERSSETSPLVCRTIQWPDDQYRRPAADVPTLRPLGCLPSTVLYVFHRRTTRTPRFEHSATLSPSQRSRKSRHFHRQIDLLTMAHFSLITTWWRRRWWWDYGKVENRGVATGGIWVYTPQKKSVQVNFLWATNDVRTAIEHEYFRSFITPQKFLLPPPPKKKILATPLVENAANRDCDSGWYNDRSKWQRVRTYRNDKSSRYTWMYHGCSGRRRVRSAACRRRYYQAYTPTNRLALDHSYRVAAN